MTLRTIDRSSADSKLARGVVVPVDGATLARPDDRLLVVPTCQEAHVVDLWDPAREELDRASSQVAVVVLRECRVVGAIELVDVTRSGVLVGKDAVDVPAQRLDPLREVGHLLRREDAVKIRVARGCRHGSRGS